MSVLLIQEKKTIQAPAYTEMSQNQTSIKDELDQPRTFTFDYSFWSHDCYIEKEDGYLSPDSSANPNFVFDALGRQILDNAWEGYHCCLFAYGQTGSGNIFNGGIRGK